jgi:hypothetical protein
VRFDENQSATSLLFGSSDIRRFAGPDAAMHAGVSAALARAAE